MAKIDLDTVSSADLEELLKAKRIQEQAQKEKPYEDIKISIEKLGTFDDFVKWYKKKNAIVIFSALLEINGRKEQYVHLKGTIGKIPDNVKNAIIAMGEEKALSFTSDEDGQKWVKNIFHPKAKKTV